MQRCFRSIAGICGALLCVHAAAGPADARRVALVIGNAEYKVGPLANPVSDAAAVAEAFGRLGFDKVMLKRNLAAEAFRAALLEMSRESAGAELGVVYFAGHGMEVAGKNFLIPVDARLAKAGDLSLEAIALDTVLEQLAGVTRLKLVILDACRNDPFPVAGARRSAARGLHRIEPEDNTLVVYAAKDGTTAEDGAGRRHSPFTEALLKHIATPGLEIGFVFRRVRDDVVAATNPVQYPHVYGTLGGKEVYLKPQASPPAAAAPAPASPAPQSSEAAERAWAAAKDTTSIAVLEAFRRQYGASNAFYDRLAEVRIDELKRIQEFEEGGRATRFTAASGRATSAVGEAAHGGRGARAQAWEQLQGVRRLPGDGRGAGGQLHDGVEPGGDRGPCEGDGGQALPQRRSAAHGDHRPAVRSGQIRGDVRRMGRLYRRWGLQPQAR